MVTLAALAKPGVFSAVPRGPRRVQAPLSGGDPEDQEREEAEAEREKAEGDGEPQASGQRPSRPEKPGVRGGPLPAPCRS